MSIALVIIYNHRYDKNIDTVEKIYGRRFSHICHLMPFYDGIRENVIPVYENSFYFQSYVAQGSRIFFRQEYTHYLFIADDMVLNPAINETNCTDIFKLDGDSCFLPRLSNVPQYSQYWTHNRNALIFNPFKMHGVEIAGVLPSREDASKKLSYFGVQNTSFLLKSVYNMKRIFAGQFLTDKILYRTSLRKGVKYPLVRSYSDIFIVAKTVISQFAQYCGAFAATNLFVELAIPTAMVLSAKKIITEKDLNMQGKALWTEKDKKILEPYKNDLNLLLQNFPETHIYIHPIKLSKWNTTNL
jgi:hypothetical protein